MIKILNLDEVKYAVELSRKIYDYSIRNRQQNMSCDKYFDDYMNLESIQGMVEAGSLNIWGLIEEGQLRAVSGMTREGHITMLYTHPSFFGKRYGAKLLETMRGYAYNEYKLDLVTVNAMPVWSSTYFMRNEFESAEPAQNISTPFIPMKAKSIKYKQYETRPISGKTLLAIIAFFLCLLFGSSFGYIIYFLTSH